MSMEKIKFLKEKEQIIASKIYAIDSGIEGLLPIADGIINIENYINAKNKILWILKEPVDEWVIVEKTGKPRNGGWNLVLDIYDKLTMEDIKKDRNLFVAKKIMEATHKLLPEINDPLLAFKSIAYINIKKIPGGSSKCRKSSSRAILKKEYIKSKDLLREQIETYNPDIIICGNTLQFFSEDNYFEKSKGVRQPFKEGKNYCFYPLKNRLYINIHHPAFYHSNKGAWKNCMDELVYAVSHWNINYKGK